MLLDVGCKYVILGHSERRHKFGNPILFVNQKVRFASAAGLNVIMCVGRVWTNATPIRLRPSSTNNSLWIGWRANRCIEPPEHRPTSRSGRSAIRPNHATPEQAQEAHAVIRHRFGQLFDAKSAQTLAIQYGGSVKPDNAAATPPPAGRRWRPHRRSQSARRPVSSHRPDCTRPASIRWPCRGAQRGRNNLMKEPLERARRPAMTKSDPTTKPKVDRSRDPSRRQRTI